MKKLKLNVIIIFGFCALSSPFSLASAQQGPLSLMGKTVSVKQVRLAQASSIQANNGVRLDQQAETIRRLRGDVEDLKYQLNELKTKMSKMQEDIEYRLEALEDGQSKAPHKAVKTQKKTLKKDDIEQSFDNRNKTGSPVKNVDNQSIKPNEGDGYSLSTAPKVTQAEQGAVTNGANLQAQYQKAYGYVQKGDYLKAQKALQKFIKGHRQNVLAGKALFWLGETYYAQGLYTKAINSYLDAYKRYPNNARAPYSLFKAALSQSRAGQSDAACQTLTHVLTQYGAHNSKINVQAKREMSSLGCAK